MNKNDFYNLVIVILMLFAVTMTCATVIVYHKYKKIEEAPDPTITMTAIIEVTCTPTPLPTATPTPTPSPTPTPTPTPAPSEDPEYQYQVSLDNGLIQPRQEDGQRLTAYIGVYNGPSGRETYYNLRMSRVVSIMRDKGYSEEEYPYWIREDGVKMLGSYVMVAANLRTRPKGTIIETSLGTAIVVDTGSFVSEHPNGIDIAVDW